MIMAVTNAALESQLAAETEWRNTIVARAMALATGRGVEDDVRRFLRSQGFDVPEMHRYQVRLEREVGATQYKYADVTASSPEEASRMALEQEAAGRNRRSYWDVAEWTREDDATVTATNVERY